MRATVLSAYLVAIGAASGGAWAYGVGTFSKEPGAVQLGALPLGMGAPLVWTAAAVLAIPSSCLWYAAGRRAHLPYLAGASALLSSVFCWVALDSGDPRDLQRAAGLMVLSSGLLLVEGISLSGALWELSQQGVDLRVVLSPEGARGELFLRF